MHPATGEAIMGTMTDDKVKRRLTTVLCADVHGYSRLMEADEAGTLATLRRYRADLRPTDGRSVERVASELTRSDASLLLGARHSSGASCLPDRAHPARS